MTLDIQTLIWLFPIMFIFHDFEEIIMMEKWLEKNLTNISGRLPSSIALKVIKQFSMSTAQMTVAVLVIFLFVSSSSFFASQYINQGSFSNIYIFTVIILAFFVHVFTHIGQSILFRSLTPGIVSSIFIVLPYSIIMINSLIINEIITWQIIFICLPFMFLLLPIVIFAHWIGKKTI
ncbi:uncharacterized protein with HXXEE motif [Ureibacillus xyleni]|uniref:Uncharacterized protein with HXXEE motif n=1 Tax=Ureibacillus xyleni TaxID=614648 RepID=A0A285RCZ0_9BACL|nr:HXXEE domain-containing protein [Ureibacillus xyleni]SOB91975.1 uncharacterized protein with HXXEE motif [Ureibacillus xyleni]